MKRLVTAILFAAATIALPSSVLAGDPAVCNFSLATHTVTVDLRFDVGANLTRDVAGHILLNDNWCSSSATVTNTDSIVVNGDDGDSQAIYIGLANKGFKPGFTNEPGKSDEIEFTINLGGGTDDHVFIEGGNAADKIDLGQKTNIFGIVRQANLNAGEKVGDADVSMVKVEHITVVGGGGNDVIRARGKAGTGPDPVTLPLNIYGGNGADTLKGGDGPDSLYGNAGVDHLWGYGGGDNLDMAGDGSNDVGYGGAGLDSAFYDVGDTWHQD